MLLDFFVAAPGFGAGGGAARRARPIEVDFGDARQIFHVGASSCGAYGNPAGIDAAMARWGSLPLAELAAPAAALARGGDRRSTRSRRRSSSLLEAILRSTPEARALFAPDGPLLLEGDVFRCADLGDTIERLGAEGSAPFYDGDIAAAVVAHVAAGGGALTAEDLRRYEAIARAPLRRRATAGATC